MEYGFFRNLAGGMIFFILVDLLLMFFAYLHNDSDVIILSILLLILSIIYLIPSWYILDNYGTKYAKQLFDEYMVIK